MSSLFEKKPWIVLLSLMALAALMALSVSVEKVSFGDAQPIRREEAEQLTRPPLVPLKSADEESLSSQVILGLALLFLVALIAVLLSPEGRKRLFRFLFRFVFTVWGLYFLFSRYPGVFDFLAPGAGGDAPRAQSPATVAGGAPPVFTPPEETPLLTYAVSLLIVLGAIVAGWRLFRVWQATTRRPSRSLEDLARIARTSLRELSDGRETTDVILNCYFRMSDVVADQRNLQRGLGMTPAEFASRLEEAGLPGEAVRRLTRLFESVRYGDRRAGPKEVNEAVACLTTILQYCGEAV
ncbi:MAG: DUF4129 domain-containing protein [Chloroflexota bacterium]